MPTIANALEQFLHHLKFIQDYKEVSLRKVELLVSKVERELKCDLVEATARDIELAIIAASHKRKLVNNGGYQDQGQLYRFRLGVAIGQYCRWLTRERLVDRNPFPENTFRKPPKREAKYLNDAQLHVLYHQVKFTVEDHVMIRVFVDTAIRREELCRLKLRDIDLNDRRIHIRQGKGDQFRTVPFTETTKKWIQLFLDLRQSLKTEWLFCRRDGQPLSANALGERVSKLNKTSGVLFTCHSLRHTAGRLWAEAGINQGIIMRYLGHTSSDMSAIYIHGTIEKLKELQTEIMQKKGFETTSYFSLY